MLHLSFNAVGVTNRDVLKIYWRIIQPRKQPITKNIIGNAPLAYNPQWIDLFGPYTGLLNRRPVI